MRPAGPVLETSHAFAFMAPEPFPDGLYLAKPTNLRFSPCQPVETLQLAHAIGVSVSLNMFVQTIPKIANRIDGVVTELAAQFLAQLADMAFNHVLFDILVENSVDGIEDLGLAHAPAAMIDQIFKDSALAPWQRQRNSLELRIPAVEKAPQFANHGTVALALAPAPDCSHPGQYFANMDRFAHHVINPRREQIQRLLETRCFVHGDYRSTGAILDHLGIKLPVPAVPEEKCFDRDKVGVGHRGHPFLKFQGTKSGGGNAFAAKTACVTRCYNFTFVNYHQHLKLPGISPSSKQ